MARSLLLLFACFAVATTARGEETAATRMARSRAFIATAESRIYDQLGLPTQMVFPDITLQDAVGFLSEYHKVRIIIDKKALADAGVDLESPIDIRVTDISLRSGLDILLRELDLTWLIANEVLVITTADAAQERKSTKNYPVADLLAGGPLGMPAADRGAIDDLAAAVALVLNEELGDLKPAVGAAEKRGEAAAEEEVRADAIRDVIVKLPPEPPRAFAHPRIRPFRGRLIVKASFHEHERIGELLTELRADNTTLPQPRALPPLSPANVGAPPAVVDPVPSVTPPLPLPAKPKDPVKIKPVSPGK